MLIHAIIPARYGSKSIPKKNIKIYKDKPLLVHSIKQALKSRHIDRVIVSTDSDEIRKIAIENGAEAPFLRPELISGDYSLDIECFQHYLDWLKYVRGKKPDILVHLRPTYPERDVDFLDKCIRRFLNKYLEYDSLRTVIKMEKSPFKMYTITKNKLNPLFTEYKDMKEPYNSVRQLLPDCYLHNGCIDIVKSKIVEKGSMTGENILPVIMDEMFDIDTEDDWEKSINYVSQK